MKKTILIFTALVILQTGCKGKSPGYDERMGDMAGDAKLAENNVTKLIRVDDLHVAFDFMAMPYHMQMMKLMHADMKYEEGATHGLMVTVMDYQTKKILKDAQVSLTITAPDGKVTQHETEIMHGAGMHHYAVHLKAAERGNYLISAQIKHNGKTYNAKTEFTTR
ncbi:MAG: hypothetical protein OEV66_00555 [Spirochaetia bacterium]|nr:hypothetical protein [Spirochaetia bacterium]